MSLKNTSHISFLSIKFHKVEQWLREILDQRTFFISAYTFTFQLIQLSFAYSP